MKKTLLTYFTFFLLISQFQAQPLGFENNHIKTDQFGYPTTAQKIAVISNPQTGYNAGQPFTPGTLYRVKKWSDNQTVAAGNIVAWNGGETHDQSGDKVWWFDFSGVTTPGEYYIYDSLNNARSYQFKISDCVYQDVLKQAMRTYYYQRCGIAKSVPYAEASWADGICHHGTQQDLDCRLVSNTNASTSKILSGGWHDAGDYNKYVPFTYTPLIDLMLAYEENPGAWTDDYDIPESGNNVPDILDEAKYELDWLLLMQQTNGSLLHKISVTNFDAGSPPSTDVAFRRYGAASTTSTVTGAAVFAAAAIQFQSIGNTTYATTLRNAAINAWNWVVANPPVVFSNAGFSNVSAEYDNYERLARKVTAAAFLFRLTGENTYKTFFDANYNQINLMQWGYAYPFEATHQDGLLYYTKSSGATTSVKNNILSAFNSSMQTNNGDNLPAFNNQTDAYRAYMASNNYTWGSNTTKANQGNMFFSMDEYNQSTADSVKHKNAGFGFIHYLHGVNPTAYCYLSNMGDHGAEFSVPEFYHGWFNDGTIWDNVNTSLYGPAPGFIPGGANPSYQPDGAYSGPPISPPQNQPVQKSFKAWNTGWPENSWEITENAIYSQAAYVRLLSKWTQYNQNPPSCDCFVDVTITGPESVCEDGTYVYSVVAGPAGTIYSWTATGGTIISGQGTNSITVDWNNSGAGDVSVSVTYP